MDKDVLDYCNKLCEITGQIKAYSKVATWIYEPGVNTQDLYEMINKAITNLINESNEIKS